PKTDIGNAALQALGERMRVNPAMLAAVKKKLDASVDEVAQALNKGNDGESLTRKLVDLDASALSDTDKIEETQKSIDEFAKLREGALKEQENDSFELPKTMKDGIWDGKHKSKGGKVLKWFKHQAQSVNWMLNVKRGILALDAG